MGTRKPWGGKNFLHDRASWKFLHMLAEGYSDLPSSKEQNDMLNFLRFFAKIYPCQVCKTHTEAYFRRYPPNVKSRRNLIKYFHDFHNSVNISLNKPLFIY